MYSAYLWSLAPGPDEICFSKVLTILTTSISVPRKFPGFLRKRSYLFLSSLFFDPRIAYDLIFILHNFSSIRRSCGHNCPSNSCISIRNRNTCFVVPDPFSQRIPLFRNHVFFIFCIPQYCSSSMD